MIAELHCMPAKHKKKYMDMPTQRRLHWCSSCAAAAGDAIMTKPYTLDENQLVL